MKQRRRHAKDRGRRRTASPPLRGRPQLLWLAGALGLVVLLGLLLWLRNPTVSTQAEVQSPEAQPVAEIPPAVEGLETPAQLRRESEALAARVLQRFPGDTGALSARARVEFQLGRSAEAEKWWRRSLEADARYAPAYRGLAQIAADKGDYEETAALRRKALELDPGSTTARADLAEALLKLGEPGQVVALLQQVDTRDPMAAWAFYLRGQAQLQLEDYESAEQSYKTALELRPGWDVAYYGVISALSRSGQQERSNDYLRQFQESRAKEREARKDVRADYDDARLMRQELADACVDTGDVYARHGAVADAEALWQRAAILDARNVASRWRLVSRYESTQRDADAQRLLQEIAALQPGNVRCRIALGVLLARTRQLDAAEGAFRDVIRLAPQLSVGYVQLARLLMVGNRNVVEARTAAEQAVRLEPSAENYAVLGASRQMNGDLSGAIEALEQAMRLDPENRDYPRIHASLRRGM